MLWNVPTKSPSKLSSRINQIVSQIKEIVETFIDENLFTIPIWFHFMFNEHEAKALHPNGMSLFEVIFIILSSTSEIECDKTSWNTLKYAAK